MVMEQLDKVLCCMFLFFFFCFEPWLDQHAAHAQQVGINILQQYLLYDRERVREKKKKAST